MTQPNAISTFTFAPAQAELRVIQIEGAPWFLAKDVCDALELETNHVRRTLDEDEVETTNLVGSGGRAPLIVSESGLYALILKSRKPEARKFRKWVTAEVLPAIRKGGMYMTEAVAKEAVEDNSAFLARAMLAAQAQLASQTAELERLRKEADMVSVDEWRATSHLYLTQTQKVALGSTAATLCIARGIPYRTETRRLPGPRGDQIVRVNVYRRELLAETARLLEINTAPVLELACGE